ncbi:hypothetical protein ABZ611_14155 [Streptomyces sp. NPDC007861]|uniref:hypothetical protein n=1 Tax=Streptomyces sp. NPDC007861 TaxID=3154893 RepID=UPI0033FD9131
MRSRSATSTPRSTTSTARFGRSREPRAVPDSTGSLLVVRGALLEARTPTDLAPPRPGSSPSPP